MDMILPIIVGLGGILIGLTIALKYVQPILARKIALNMIPQTQYDELSDKYADKKMTIEQLKSAVKSCKFKAEGLQKRVIELEAQLANNQPDYGKMKAQTQEIETLTKEIESVKANYVRAEQQDTTELDLKQKEVDEARVQIENQTARIAELEDQLTHQTAKLDRLENPPVVPPIKPKTTSESAQEAENNEAKKAGSEESKPKPATPKPALSKAISDLEDEDNLLTIKGIGEVIQDKLNQEGIRSFKDLSELDEEKIKELQAKTHIFPSKLRKWRDEAKKIVQKRTEEA